MTVAVASARRIMVEPRARASLWIQILVPVVSVIAAAAVATIVLALSGHSPGDAYQGVIEGSFGSQLATARTLILATPLTLTGLAAAVAFKMNIWNIGAEGQLFMGAVAASGVALALGDSVPALLLVPIVIAAGMLAGAAWAALAAIPRAYLNTDEVISTLMLNFVALHFMTYLVFGSVSYWRDKERVIFPVGRVIARAGELPRIWGRLHAGILIAMVLAVVVWLLLRSTRWGFELRTVGDSSKAARYAGMNVNRKIVSVLLVSGALAGIAGAIEVAGVAHRLDPNGLATNLGFTGIVVAAVARLNPLGVVPVAILLAGLSNSGITLQLQDIPIEIVLLLQGMLLLFVVGGEFFLKYRVRLNLAARSGDIL